MLVRPFCAFTEGAVLACCALKTLRERNCLRHAACGLFGVTLTASVLLFYNHFTTGNALLPGYIKLWGESHGLGFHQTPWGEFHTPLRGLRNEFTNLVLLHAMLFEWPIPSCLLLALAMLFGLLPSRWDRRLFFLALAFPLSYLFYWHNDAILGPRFLYGSLLGFIPLTARTIRVAVFTQERSSQNTGKSVPFVRSSRLLSAAFGVCIFYAVAIGIPFRFAVYRANLPSMKEYVIPKAREQGIQSALIFIPVAWGSRILALMRASGVSAPDAERLYRIADHCLLAEKLEEARSRGLTGTALKTELESSASEPVVKVNLNGDPSLRLRPNMALSAKCAEEIRYDKLGYSVFLPHLIENAPELSGPYVVATDLREKNPALRAEYHELPAYLYRNGTFSPLP